MGYIFLLRNSIKKAKHEPSISQQVGEGGVRSWKHKGAAQRDKRHSASGEAVVALIGGERVVGKWVSRLVAMKERGGEGGWQQIEPLGGVALARSSTAAGSTTKARGSTVTGSTTMARNSMATGGATMVTDGTTMRHNDSKGQQGNRRHDDGEGQQGNRRYGNGRHNNSKGQQGDRQQDDADGWHNGGKGQQSDRRHNNGKGQQGDRRHNDSDGCNEHHDNGDRQHNDAAQQCGMTTAREGMMMKGTAEQQAAQQRRQVA